MKMLLFIGAVVVVVLLIRRASERRARGVRFRSGAREGPSKAEELLKPVSTSGASLLGITRCWPELRCDAPRRGVPGPGDTEGIEHVRRQRRSV